MIQLDSFAGSRIARLHAVFVVGIVIAGWLLWNWPDATALALGTFVSEDATCVTAGVLVQQGLLSWWPALLGSFVGIYVGDLALWSMGRLLGRRVFQVPWIACRVSNEAIDRLGTWFDERGWFAIVVARFLPGTRLPLYLAAGMLGRKGWQFAGWTLLAALVWTPLLVGGVAALGSSQPLSARANWIGPVLAGGGALFALALIRTLASPNSRGKWAGRVARLWRWEFWPTWLFYLPAIPWLAWLALRHRSLTVWTAANPGIPDGGVVGESKFDILAKLPKAWIVPSELLTGSSRIAELRRILAGRGWQFPLILKPDVGQRGAGVALVRSIDEAAEYLDTHTGAIVTQPFHPGPFEAGVFYVRMPTDHRGRIFSITDKRFPALIGDGSSTIDRLIWSHPRYRMQAATLRANVDPNQIPRAGESISLTIAGNHCRGTMFLDGGHFVTPELEARFDEIAHHFDGFFFGRFDVRYADEAAFKAGLDFAIVELNGVASESTNLYDPRNSLVAAYRILFRQWDVLFRIGASNHRRGYQPASLRRLAGMLWRYLRGTM